MPVILGPDGPSLGGFVCPVTIARAELWKMGQLKAGDRVRFIPLTDEAAARLDAERRGVPGPAVEAPHRDATSSRQSPILESGSSGATADDALVYRRDGDDNVLVEFGPPVLDLGLRLRAHALMQALEGRKIQAIIDLTPGIRSLQIHYDPIALPTRKLLALLRDIQRDLPRLEEIVIPTRVVHLPLSWEDPATLVAIEKYTRSVRPDAPWCPSNIEFIRRINGLPSVDEVRRIVFDASYMVLGLGDVYLGAPVATPLDPRHRLVTTKYNPARTWTPENAVGIGGAYLCIYGMEGPGGYQLFGRTIQVWNTYLQSPEFHDAKPWLLRFFDQIRFFPVTPEELIAWRRDFPFGRRSLRIETEMFRLRDYQLFLQENRAGIESFQTSRQAAFDLEREEWARRGEVALDDAVTATTPVTELVDVPEGAELVEAPLGGNVWKVHVQAGDSIEKGSVIAAIEAMKTECNVPSPASGIVRAVYIRERQHVAPGMP